MSCQSNFILLSTLLLAMNAPSAMSQPAQQAVSQSGPMILFAPPVGGVVRSHPARGTNGWDAKLRAVMISGDYAKAESILLARLNAMKSQPKLDSKQVVKILDQLTEVEIVLNRMPKAENYARRVLKIVQNQQSVSPINEISQTHRLAEIQDAAEMRPRAATTYQSELQLTNAVYGPNDAADILAVHDLARNFEAQGKYDESIELYSRELALWAEIYGPQHMSLSSSYIDLGRTHAKAHQYEQALKSYSQALTLLQQDCDANASEIESVIRPMSEIKSTIANALSSQRKRSSL